MSAGPIAAALLRVAEEFTASIFAGYGLVESRDVHLRPIRNALITPRRFPSAGEMTGAVHDGEGRLLRSSLRILAGSPLPVDPDIAPAADVAVARRLPAGLYGGTLYMALGHHLFETVSRLWPLMAFERRAQGARGARIIFHGSPGLHLGGFSRIAMLRESLAAFGIRRADILVVEEPLRVDVLHYPEPLSIYHEFMHPLMSELFDHLASELGRARGLAAALPSRKAAAKRVFLSRSRWPHEVRITNEDELEATFRARGFATVHTQELSPHDLVRTLQAADTVAASDGTHGHLVAFCRPGTRTILLDTRLVPTQVAVEKVRRLRALHLPLYIDPEGIYDRESGRVDPGRLGPFLDAALEAF